MAWTLADLGRPAKQAALSKPEVPGLAHSVPATSGTRLIRTQHGLGAAPAASAGAGT